MPLDVKNLAVSFSIDGPQSTTKDLSSAEKHSETYQSVQVEVGSTREDIPLFEDFWEWVTPDFLRRTHVQARTSLFPNSPAEMYQECQELEPIAVHIRDHSVEQSPSVQSELGVQVLVFDWQKQTPLTFPFSWQGETWFMHKGQTKRNLFASILKHSQTRVFPRLLRTAWKHSCFHSSHGSNSSYGASSQVRDVLGTSRTATSQAQQGGCSSQDKGGADPCPGANGDMSIFQATAERDASTGAEVSLQGAEHAGPTSLLSIDSSEHASSRRIEGNVQSAWDGSRRRLQEGRTAEHAASALGGTMRSGHTPSEAEDGEWSRNISCSQNRCQSKGSAQACRAGSSADLSSEGHQEQASQRERRRSLGSGTRCATKSRSAEGYSCSRDASSSHAPGVRDCSDTVPARAAWQGGDQVRVQATETEAQVFSVLLSSHRKTLGKSSKRQLHTALSEYQHFATDIACLSAKVCEQRQPVVLEVFAGSMHWSCVAASRGWKVLQPIDIALGPNSVDLGTQGGQLLVDEQIQRYTPDLITWAPPCGPYSPLQSIMPRDPKRRR